MLGRRDFLGLATAGTLEMLLPRVASAVVPEPLHRVDPQFFGFSMAWPVSAPYIQNIPSVPMGAWRACLPELHWFSLEPSRGVWKFDKLDIAMRLMAARGVEVMYTLGNPPAWASSRPDVKGPYVYGELAPPRNLDDWENYVRTIARRYRGRIRCYDLWCEPRIREVDGDQAYFSVAQLVELGRVAYRVIKEEDPAALLTTPSMDGGESGIRHMDAYLAAGGRECADVVAFHFYGMPEQIPQYQAGLLKVMARNGVGHLPVWNTESGFLIEDPTSANSHPLSSGAFSRVLPEIEAAAWVGRSLIIAASVGIERFYWFMWDGQSMGLVTWVGRHIKPAGVAYGTTARWLIGKRIGQMRRTGNIVTSPLVGPDGDVAWLAWTHDYSSMRWIVPKEWSAERIEFLDGRSQAMTDGRNIELSAAPVLISSRN